MTWIRDNLVKGQRLLLISGAPRIGKTSLLRQVAQYLPDIYIPVRLGLFDDEVTSLDQALWRLADDLAQYLAAHLDAPVPRPDWADFEGHTERLLASFWPEARAALGGLHLLLMLDDADSLAASGGELLASLLAVLRSWTEQDRRLALIVTLSISPERLEAGLAPGAPAAGLPLHVLGPLSGEDATRLMTVPVEGVLTYDYGVVRRLVEITSGQPYYLQLLAFELFNRCAKGGWVNQRDVDVVVEHLTGREILDFRQVWDGSTPQEQAVLGALVSLRVSRGVAGPLEVHTLLINAGARVERQQVADVLDQLARRGILERLGVSYRFRVSLLGDWLRERVDLAKVARAARWAKERDRDRQPADEGRAARRQPAAAAPVQAGPPPGRRFHSRWFWLAPAVVFGVGLAVVFLLGWLAPPRSAAEPTTRPTATPRPMATSQPGTRVTDQPIVAGPSATPLPLDTRAVGSVSSPTPTPPVVISRPIPAIAYQSHPAGQDVWSIYVMDSDGGHPQRLTDGKVKAMMPAWSGDGSRIAYVSYQDGNPDIWVMDVDPLTGTGGSSPTNLTRHPAQDQWPAWSPVPQDGEGQGEIAFASVRDARYWELYVMQADGSNVRRLTWWNDASDLGPTWSPDGTRIAFTSKRDGNWEIYTIDRDGRNLTRLTFDPADDTNPSWSPDGTRIAFESTRTGYADLFVMPAAGGQATNLTNQPLASDHGPTWSPDGGRIAFFSDRDGEWDIYVMGADGSNVVQLTGDDTVDQVPAWRP